MIINKAMILAAGLGSRMAPITNKIPKPLVKIGKSNLLDQAINLLINHGVENIVINVHHLADQIENFIKKKEYKINISISNERKELLNTGGGILQATRDFKDEPFFVLNPDTMWTNIYNQEIELLKELYNKFQKTSLLLVDKNLSFDNSFKGDFNLSEKNFVSRDNINQFIFTGLQILNRGVFESIDKKIFSMNIVWNNLISSNSLLGLESKQKFYHVNTKDIYDKLKDKNIIY